MSLSESIFRIADQADIPPMVALINSAYRGDSSRVGWTTEADLLEGLRTTEAELFGLYHDDDSVFLLCIQDANIIGTVHLQNCGTFAYVGMFVIHPSLQGAGLGKAFLNQAEQYIRHEWQLARIEMTVISMRHELIAYYKRRGYCPTGELRPFPLNSEITIAKVENLEIAVLEKKFATEGA